MTRLNYINDIYTTTSVKNAVNFNYGTHIRMIKEGLVDQNINDGAFNEYPPQPSRRILNSRSSHYPFLQHIYKDLPSRLMFYIPSSDQLMLSRKYLIQKIYSAAYSCLNSYMKGHYKSLNNSIISKLELNPENYHSKLSSYMPDYYYIYKATQFEKDYATYNTKNNFYYNNYIVMYILFLVIIILWPLYHNIYIIESIFMYNINDYIKLVFFPDYSAFIASFVHNYSNLIHNVVNTAVMIQVAFNKIIYYSPISLGILYEKLVQIISMSYSYFSDLSVHDSRFWRAESSAVLASMYDLLFGIYYYILTFGFYPISSLFSIIVTYCSDIRVYYFVLMFTLFYGIIRHGSGGFNQVIKDYVGSKGYFYSYYGITIYVSYLLVSYLYFNLYGEEPFMILNFLFFDTYFKEVLISIYHLISQALDGIITTIGYHTFFKYLIHV